MPQRSSATPTGRISLPRCTGGDEEYITLLLEDDAIRIRVELTLEQFARVVTGATVSGIVLEVRPTLPKKASA